jgi:UDP-N-acetylglucosamine 2-epimerase (non-hydrolysing)
MKVCIVFSTRPEIIKLASFIKILKEKKVNFFLVNTNQHYSNFMSKIFLDFFKIPKVKFNLKAKTKSPGIFFSETIYKIEKILVNEKPDYLVVQGDTNTSLAGCLAASMFNRNLSKNTKKIEIVHIEAGLRSFDENMPEEINRRLIDQLSTILFVPTVIDMNNLKKENLSHKKIYKVGNTISDIFKTYIPKIIESNILEKLNVSKKKYFLITAHRPESIDNLKNLLKLLNYFEKIGFLFNSKFIFPVHPRTNKNIKKLDDKNFKFIRFISPLGYIDFLKLMQNSRIVFTDSGGIQEEASMLGVPCITLRTTTERQITILKKMNILAGYDYSKILKSTKIFFNKKIKKKKLFGNGNVSKIIFDKLFKV